MEMCSGTYLAAKKAPGRTMEICRGTFAGGALHRGAPREAQRNPEKPREPQRGTDAQRGPERPREAEIDLERDREAEHG